MTLAVPSRDEAYAVLQHALIVGDLPPGSRLNDADLVRLTGTSRAPLREALNQLAMVGLVDVAPRRSTHVTPLDGRASRESLEIDGAVIAQALAEVADDLPAALRETLLVARDTMLADPAAYREAVRSGALRTLFDAIVSGTGNAEYARLCAAVGPVVDRYASLHADALGDSHHTRMRAAVDAALDGDSAAAREAWRGLVDVLLTDAAMTGGADEPEVPPPPTTLRQRAADAIAQAIHDGTLLPGETLRESELMEWLGVSRTPVREALTALDREGLVEQSHHRSARVVQLDERDLVDLLRAVAVLRSLAVRLTMQQDPAALERTLAATLPAWDRVDDPESFTAAAGASLDAITAGCPNGRLRRVTSTLVARGRWSAVHVAYEAVARDGRLLRALHDAVVAGRPADAEAAVWDIYLSATPR
jgi:DNA-binding GntR family transcriptional regulator